MTARVTRRGLMAATASALAAGTLVAWVTTPHQPPLRSTGALTMESRPGVAMTAAPAPSPTATTGRPSLAAHPAVVTAAVVAVPLRLSVPRLGVRMPVIPVGVDRTGAMALPATPGTAGWYRYGPSPSSAAGATVIAGHVDTAGDGAGPLARLRSAHRGDVVVVATTNGSTTYVVTDVLRVPKSDVDLKAVFTRVGPARLHLVTCGGAFDRRTGHYEDNVVVVAEPRRQ